MAAFRQVAIWGEIAGEVKRSWLNWVRKQKGTEEDPRDYGNISVLEHLYKGAAGCVSDALSISSRPSRALTQNGGVQGRGTALGLIIAHDFQMRFPRRRRDPEGCKAFFGRHRKIRLAQLFLDLVQAYDYTDREAMLQEVVGTTLFSVMYLRDCASLRFVRASFDVFNVQDPFN